MRSKSDPQLPTLATQILPPSSTPAKLRCYAPKLKPLCPKRLAEAAAADEEFAELVAASQRHQQQCSRQAADVTVPVKAGGK